MPKKKRAYNLTELSGTLALHLVLLCINLWLFLRIGLQTLIPTLGLVELYVLLGLLFSIFTREEKLKYKTLIGFSLVPLLINLLLCINYWFSFNPVTETYSFRAGEAKVGAIIILPNNTYSAYHGIRMFWDPGNMEQNSRITYTFKTGLFGIRVMTGYEFI
jgi:hypothetical protein